MKNITLYNEVDFHSSGMTMRQAYGIGPGITFSNDEIKSFSTTQGETGFDLINDFSVPYAQEGRVHEKQPPTSSSVVEFTTGTFLCTEDGCTATFHSYKDLEEHIIIGLHDLEVCRESSYDKVKRHWARYCNDIVLADRKCAAASTRHAEAPSIGLPQGWALKVVKPRPRFPTHVKTYLKTKYEAGENSGRKVTPQEVAKEMKTVTSSIGQRIFSGRECLTVSQISSYFSRLGNLPSSCEKMNVKTDEDLMAVLAELDENAVFENMQ